MCYILNILKIIILKSKLAGIRVYSIITVLTQPSLVDFGGACNRFIVKESYLHIVFTGNKWAFISAVFNVVSHLSVFRTAIIRVCNLELSYKYNDISAKGNA